MKIFFLVLLIVKSPTEYYYLKVPFGYSLIPVTCEEQFEKVVTYKTIENDGIYTIYKGLAVGGHFCIDEHGNYYNGYEEKLDWELGH